MKYVASEFLQTMKLNGFKELFQFLWWMFRKKKKSERSKRKGTTLELGNMFLSKISLVEY